MVYLGFLFIFFLCCLHLKGAKVLQMINYFAFLSLKVRVFMITPLHPPYKNAWLAIYKQWTIWGKLYIWCKLSIVFCLLYLKSVVSVVEASDINVTVYRKLTFPLQNLRVWSSSEKFMQMKPGYSWFPEIIFRDRFLGLKEGNNYFFGSGVNMVIKNTGNTLVFWECSFDALLRTM